jgi:hypothetical protein
MDWTTGLMISAAVVVGLKIALTIRKVRRHNFLARLAAQGASDALMSVVVLPSLAERIALAKRLQKHYETIHRLTVAAGHDESEAYYRGACRSVETYLQHVGKPENVQ